MPVEGPSERGIALCLFCVVFFTVSVELLLERPLVFLAIRPMTRTLRPERNLGTGRTNGFNRNVA